MVAGGALEVRPGEDDPGALALMGRLSTSSRRRWPVASVAAPRAGVPPPKSASAGAATATTATTATAAATAHVPPAAEA